MRGREKGVGKIWKGKGKGGLWRGGRRTNVKKKKGKSPRSKAGELTKHVERETASRLPQEGGIVNSSEKKKGGKKSEVAYGSYEARKGDLWPW